MALSIFHRGQKLTEQQLAVINPIIVDHMNNETHVNSKKKFEQAIDKALEEAGCPIVESSTQQEDPIGPISHINWISAAIPVPQRIRDAQFILKTDCGLAVGRAFSDGSGFDCENIVLEYAMCTESFFGLDL